jgi:opacity protein-like surface antigen
MIKADVSPSNTPNINGSDSAFAYQVLAGFNIGEVAPNVLANVGYRYISTFDDLKVGTTEFDYDTHQAEAGLKFRF